MKLGKCKYFAAMMLLSTLAIPAGLVAQEEPDHGKEYPRFKLIDIGTFGGPNDIVNGPNVAILSSDGT
jgi:hypothetical protein